MTQEQLSKLPKWAKDEINRLTIDNSSLKNKLEQFEGKQETNVFISDGIDKKPLPLNASIDFCLGERNLNRVSVYITRSGQVNIQTDSRSGKEMVLVPQAANSFNIKFI